MSAKGRKRKDGKTAPKPPNEFFPTPAFATHALIRETALPPGRWLEPAAGDGAIIRAVADLRTDIRWHAVELREAARPQLAKLRSAGLVGDFWIEDFIAWKAPAPYDVAITNPPFTLTMPFIHACFGIARVIVILQRHGLCETEERARFLRVYAPDVLTLPKRPSFTGGPTDGTTYSFFIWWTTKPRAVGRFRELQHPALNDALVPLGPPGAELVDTFERQLTPATGSDTASRGWEGGVLARRSTGRGAGQIGGMQVGTLERLQDGTSETKARGGDNAQVEEDAVDGEGRPDAAREAVHADVGGGDRGAASGFGANDQPLAPGSLRAAEDVRPALEESGRGAAGGLTEATTGEGTDMRWVEFVEANLKGGIRASLGKHTLIVGETGSGKSALVNAIELALSGRVSDVNGRDVVALPAELQGLSPGRKGGLSATVRLSDGQIARWTTEGRKKSGTHELPMGIDPAKAFPLRSVREAALGSAETLRRFFLTYAAGGKRDEDILERIPALLHPYYQRAVASAKITDSPIDKLLKALETAEAKAREEKAKVQGSNAVVEQTGQGLAALPSAADVDAARQAVVEARTELERVSAAHAVTARAREQQHALGALQAQLDGVRARLAEQRDLEARVRVRLVELHGSKETLPPSPPALTDYQRAVALIIRELGAKASAGAAFAESGPVTCAGCGTAHPAQHFIDRAVQAAARLEQRAQESAQRTAIEQRIQKGEGMVASVVADIARLVQEEQRLAEFIRSAGAASAFAPVAPDSTSGNGASTANGADKLEQARQQLAAAEARLGAFAASKASWEAVKRAREAALESDTTQKGWEQLADACRTAVAELLDADLGKFKARVQAMLPEGYRFELRLREGNREVCQHGFTDSPGHTAEEKGVLHTALSGFEWAVEQAALAAAVAERWANEGQVLIVTPEDRGMSSRALTAALEAFGRLQHVQVLIATPTRPATVPPGWVVIDADKGEHRSELKSVLQVAKPAIVEAVTTAAMKDAEGALFPTGVPWAKS